jgi:hypothetical protein
MSFCALCIVNAVLRVLIIAIIEREWRRETRGTRAIVTIVKLLVTFPGAKECQIQDRLCFESQNNIERYPTFRSNDIV